MSDQKFVFSSLKGDDLQKIYDIEQTVIGGWSLPQLAGEINHPAGWQFVLRAVDNTVGAFVMGRSAAGEAEILRLAVAPDYRRQALGTQLVRELTAYLAEKSICTCFLEVRSSNASALRLYEKMGFREAGRRYAYYRHPEEDAVLMAKEIVKGEDCA